MYSTKTKVKRGDKTSTEEYVVFGETPTIVENMLAKELSGTTIEGTVNMAKININDIFENSSGTFFEIKIDYPDTEGTKDIKEAFIQEAGNLIEAIDFFRDKVSYGSLRSVKETKILGILKD